MSAIYSFNCWTSATNGWKIAYENSSTEPRSAARACVLLLDVHALRATCAGTVWAGCLFVWMTPAAILDCVSSVMTVCCCYPLWCSGSYIWGCGGGGIGKDLNSSLCLPVWDTLTDWRTVHGAGRVLSSRRRVTKWMSPCYCSTDSSAHSSLTHLHHHFHSWCEQSYCRKPS